ncbi:hypothetical protein SDC9_92288 [bioreactor metagenome]|uniref:PHP domain-containing protein n=1 Tax=bioreactor metagenome TaxID=1076179 RepID=A0A644ZX97_9ZZZZ
MKFEELYKSLYSPDQNERILTADKMAQEYKNNGLNRSSDPAYVNNHIHTTFSFSPYTPSAAVYEAFSRGLVTAGIMDHDSLGGSQEFIKAAEAFGIASTVGTEIRVSFSGTPFEKIKLNSPDQKGIAYVAVHGIPHQNIKKLQSMLAPYREKRNIRNRQMIDRINSIVGGCGLKLDFENDVIPISEYNNGGTITERHLLFALSKKIRACYSSPDEIICFIRERMNIEIPDKVLSRIKENNPAYIEYDLLGLLKQSLIKRIYIDADDELMNVREYIEIARSVGALSAYAYLGDVKASATGDKADEEFEDGFLDELFYYSKETGFDAVTFMPSRNTLSQLNRVMSLCDKLSLFQISGEDINSPRQSFICDAISRPEFRHLIASTWKLIEHEKNKSK